MELPKPPVPPPTSQKDEDQTTPVVFLDRPIPSSRVTLPEDAKQQLEALGWKPGDPVPGELGDRLRAIQAEIAEADAQDEADLPAKVREIRKRAKPPKHVKLEDLPQEKQQELRSLMDEAKRVLAQEESEAREEDAMQERLGEIPDNLRQAAEANMRSQMAAERGEQGKPGTTFSQVPDGLPSPPEGGKANVEGISPIFSEQPEEQPEEPPKEEPAQESPKNAEPRPAIGETASEFGSAEPPQTCPRCQFQLNLPLPPPPTEGQKNMFTSYMLGITDRFYEDYPVLGGRVIVTFRALSSREADAAAAWTGIDARTGKINDATSFVIRLNQYRLLFSFASLRDNAGAVVHRQEPPGEDDLKDIERNTELRDRMWEALFTKTLRQEPLRRVVGQLFAQFQRLVEGLEQEAQNPDF